MYNSVNPYNFVPFGNSCPNTVSKEKTYRGDSQKDLLSGWIDVTMHIKTPLIVPDVAHPSYLDLKNQRYIKSDEKIAKDKESNNIHNEYSFLKIYNPETEQKEYAVSGSEIRGLIRSIYEAVTNSCVPFLMNDKPMSQRVPLYGALNKRGLLGYDGKRWILYKTTKTLEEVIVVPLYECKDKYYIEDLNNQFKNNQKILGKLTTFEEKIKKYNYNNKQVKYGVQFDKKQKDHKKWNIMVANKVIEREVDKKIVDYLFIKVSGEVINKLNETNTPTGTYVEKKGWIQYNVPVDLSRVYHIAYLNKKGVVYSWPDSSAKGDETEEKKNDMLYAEAYKKLKSAIIRDGAENYSENGKRINNQTNRVCNFALEKALEDACLSKEKLVPVYYFKVIDNENNKDIVYMSGSAVGRIAQRRKWNEIMKGHIPCEKDLCPACLLFGTVKGGGMKGHVRFTDAFMTTGNEVKHSLRTLPVLASPRTTAFEFYLKKPDNKATYWNYDFYGVTENGNGRNKSYTNYYHLKNSMPRGRKMYWHHKLADVDKPAEVDKTNLNSTMESLDNGSFTFKVYFDQISKAQLQDLIWTIELGDNKVNSKYQHKLGHAKPLGYGSVKLVVDGGKVRRFVSKENDGGFGIELLNLSETGIDVNAIKPTFDINSDEVKKLLIMANIETVANYNIDYPRNAVDKPIYAWFSKNRKNPKNLHVLPEPDDDNLSF
ncbi:MAG: TIGR03986 family CRISPR-associated RAMP protein [Butyrivibrio sp.]|nr:TIGR03986 family CRISPR-associated RAMP protein [Butyrivibrio sp.]